jgi:hypothetical protein
MTSRTGSTESDVAVLDEHINIARAINVPSVLVNLTCELTVHFERLRATERVQGETSKLTSPEALQDLIANNSIARPSEHPSLQKHARVRGYELDTTTYTAVLTSQMILHLLLTITGENEYTPSISQATDHKERLFSFLLERYHTTVNPWKGFA